MAQGKFHINKAGNAAPCHATVRACRYGSADHFDNQAAAEAEAARRTLAAHGDQTFATMTKAKPLAPAAKTSAEELSAWEAERDAFAAEADFEDNCDELMAEWHKRNPQPGTTAKQGKAQAVPVLTLQKAQERHAKVAHALKLSEKHLQELDQQFQDDLISEEDYYALAFPHFDAQEKLRKEVKAQEEEVARLREASTPDEKQLRAHHNDKSRMAEAISSWEAIHGKGPRGYRQGEPHYNLYCGKLNPFDPTLGSASEYYRDDKATSLVIMARKDGKGVRVAMGSGDYYPDPQEALGEPAVQYKQQGMANDRITDDLYVVGYVDSTGHRFGYVPDRQVTAYVYK